MQSEPTPTPKFANQRKHLEIEKGEAERNHDILTRHIEALDTDIGREMDGVRRQTLKERKVELVAERNEHNDRINQVEAALRKLEEGRRNAILSRVKLLVLITAAIAAIAVIVRWSLPQTVSLTLATLTPVAAYPSTPPAAVTAALASTPAITPAPTPDCKIVALSLTTLTGTLTTAIEPGQIPRIQLSAEAVSEGPSRLGALVGKAEMTIYDSPTTGAIPADCMCQWSALADGQAIPLKVGDCAFTLEHLSSVESQVQLTVTVGTQQPPYRFFIVTP